VKYTYTAVFTPENNGLYSVDFPDLQGCYTSGENMADAIYMAHDVLNLTLYDLEQDKKTIPTASKAGDIKITGEQFTSVIAVDTEIYRRLYENKSVNEYDQIKVKRKELADDIIAENMEAFKELAK